MIIIPAYGRDYKTKKEFESDFNDMKDFKLISFNEESYCNKDDLLAMNIKSVKIRFNKLTKFSILEVQCLK